MAMYRKKPIVIEARQFTGGHKCASDLLFWMLGGADTTGCEMDGRKLLSTPQGCYNAAQDCMLIATLEGSMAASPGCWIIKGVKGEFYPCRDDIFEATYELAPVE